MRRIISMLAVMGVLSASAGAQGVLSDVLTGKLVKPKVGQWAWYDLLDAPSGRKFALRQAIVGKEKVGRKNGHWLEIEIVPDVGAISIYKMLVTGPASDPKNIHKIRFKQGSDAAVDVPVDALEAAPEDSGNAKRSSKGTVMLDTAKGPIESEHIVIQDGSSTYQIWLNDDVRPMGLVRMDSPNGKLFLRDYGEGGESGMSKADLETAPAPPSTLTVKTEVEKSGKRKAPNE